MFGRAREGGHSLGHSLGGRKAREGLPPTQSACCGRTELHSASHTTRHYTRWAEQSLTPRSVPVRTVREEKGGGGWVDAWLGEGEGDCERLCPSHTGSSDISANDFRFQYRMNISKQRQADNLAASPPPSLHPATEPLWRSRCRRSWGSARTTFFAFRVVLPRLPVAPFPFPLSCRIHTTPTHPGKLL